ncbi:MAG: hypothetical protein GY768_16725 [Planctomycetaceae bacterium]|nr:hypothetical protein [Planctomycetaceae bacterium]
MISLREGLRKSKQSLRYGSRYITTPYQDWSQNRRLLASDAHFLILRHRAHLTKYYDGFVRWLETKKPAVRSRFALHSLPYSPRDWAQIRLLVPWLPDPLLHESPIVYGRLKRIEESCRQRGIAVINPVDHLLRTAKSTGAEFVRSVGIRAPRSTPINHIDHPERCLRKAELEFPLLIREDRAHAGRLPIYLVKNLRELLEVPLHQFAHPIAVEFIDVRDSQDGLSRRYRYFAAGDLGMAMNLHCSKEWEVRGRNAIRETRIEQEELAFIREPDPNHERLQAARKALGLDFVAFDYSYGKEGELIVWEANVMPGLAFPKPSQHRPYLRTIAERAFALTLNLYYDRSGLKLPECVAQEVATPPSCWFGRDWSRAA